MALFSSPSSGRAFTLRFHPKLSDDQANAAREEEMAKRLAGVEGLGVVILGGKQDWTQALRRHAPGVRYLRVATRAYQEAAGE